IPYAHELSVPALGWQPQLHLDQGVGGRLESQLNAAVGRNVRRRRSTTSATCAGWPCAARGRRTFGHRNRAGNRGIGELQVCQTLARCCGGGGEEQERGADHGASSSKNAEKNLRRRASPYHTGSCSAR